MARYAFISNAQGTVIGCIDAQTGANVSPSYCCNAYPTYATGFCNNISHWEGAFLHIPSGRQIKPDNGLTPIAMNNRGLKTDSRILTFGGGRQRANVRQLKNNSSPFLRNNNLNKCNCGCMNKYF